MRCLIWRIAVLVLLLSSSAYCEIFYAEHFTGPASNTPTGWRYPFQAQFQGEGTTFADLEVTLSSGSNWGKILSPVLSSITIDYYSTVSITVAAVDPSTTYKIGVQLEQPPWTYHDLTLSQSGTGTFYYNIYNETGLLGNYTLSFQLTTEGVDGCAVRWDAIYGIHPGSPTMTVTTTATPTVTATATPTITATATFTATVSSTFTVTGTPTPTPTPTPTFTITGTSTPSLTPTSTPTISPTSTASPDVTSTPFFSCTATPTEVEKIMAFKAPLLLYPNPVRSNLNWLIGNQTMYKVTMEMYNSIGERIGSYKSQQLSPGQVLQWTIADQAPGLYIYRVLWKDQNNNQHSYQGKLAVVH